MRLDETNADEVIGPLIFQAFLLHLKYQDLFQEIFYSLKLLIL